MKFDYTLLAALISIPALSISGNAADTHPQSKSKAAPRLRPGLEWADTNKDGQLSNDELKRAAQIVKDKIDKNKGKSVKSAGR